MLKQLVVGLARDLRAVAALVADPGHVKLVVVGEDVIADADVLEVAAEAGDALVGVLTQDGQDILLQGD